MRLIFVVFLIFSCTVGHSQKCDKYFEVDDFDVIKKEKELETITAVFYKDIAHFSSVKFKLENKNIVIYITNQKPNVIDNGNEIGFLFENKSSCLVRFTTLEKPSYAGTSSTPNLYTNSSILSYSELLKFSRSKLEVVKYYANGDEIDVLSNTEKIKSMATCFINKLDTTTDLISTTAVQNRNYCSEITTSIDQFDGRITFTSPSLLPIAFTKIVSAKVDTSYFLSLHTLGLTSSTGQSVIILFTDGTKLEWQVETKVNVNANAEFEHAATIKLSKEDRSQLSSKKIKAFRLHIHDKEIPLEEAEKYRQYLGCVIQK